MSERPQRAPRPLGVWAALLVVPVLLWLGWFVTSSPSSPALVVWPPESPTVLVANCATSPTVSGSRRICMVGDEWVVRAWFDENRDGSWDLRARRITADGVPRFCERHTPTGWVDADAADCAIALTTP